MLKQAIKNMLLLVVAGGALISCKKEAPGSNIADTNHVQLSVNGGATHNLTQMRAYTDTFINSTLKQTTILAFNLVGGVDAGETMEIDIYHNQTLQAGDTFMAGTLNTNKNALFSYTSPPATGSVTAISFQGYPGSVTILEVTSTYIKGTFSAELFPLSDYGDSSVAYLQSDYNITNGGFYATWE
jgi:hypothetical protein